MINIQCDYKDCTFVAKEKCSACGYVFCIKHIQLVNSRYICDLCVEKSAERDLIREELQATTKQNSQRDVNTTNVSSQTKQSSPHSLEDDLKKIGFVGGYIILLISLCGIPAWTASGQNTQAAGGVGEFVGFYLATAPFTSTIAIIGLGFIRGWFKSLPVALLVMTLILFVATLIGAFLGAFGTGIDPFGQFSANATSDPWYVVLVKLVFFYYVLYGPLTFVVSITVGVFLAWAGGKMLWPHAKKFVDDMASKK